MEGLSGKQGGARELSARRKRLFGGGDIFSWRKRKGKGFYYVDFYYVDCPFLLWRMERASETDFLTRAWPENSALVKIPFLGKVGTATRSGIKSRFGTMGF